MKERNKVLVEKSKHKKHIALILMMILGLIFSQLLIGCNKIEDLNETAAAENDTNPEDEDSIVLVKNIGYISDFEESSGTRITFDPVEWITLEDTDRINELEIEEFDMPNGYYIYNSEIEEKEYELDEYTEYRFIDWGNDFSSSDEERFDYSTKDKEEFIEYLNTYTDKAAKVPFWISIKDGAVQIIEEQYVP